jgi:Tfp pilus assembly protein PilF
VNTSSEPELRAAIDAFEAAIELDPSFGEAYVGLADAYQTLATMIPGREAEALRLREAAILRATEIGPDLAATQLLLAQQYVDLWQWANAERAYLKALELSSSADFNANENYGDFLILVGRASEALPYKQRAQQKDLWSSTWRTKSRSSMTFSAMIPKHSRSTSAIDLYREIISCRMRGIGSECLLQATSMRRSLMRELRM